jgi:hypothetical protein
LSISYSINSRGIFNIREAAYRPNNALFSSTSNGGTFKASTAVKFSSQIISDRDSTLLHHQPSQKDPVSSFERNDTERGAIPLQDFTPSSDLENDWNTR